MRKLYRVILPATVGRRPIEREPLRTLSIFCSKLFFVIAVSCSRGTEPLVNFCAVIVMSLSTCRYCWEQSCQRSSDITKNCRKQPVTNVAAATGVDGRVEGIEYLSPLGQQLRHGNVTALAGIDTGGAAPKDALTTEESALDTADKIAAAVMKDLPDLLSLCSKRKDLLQVIKIKVSRLMIGAADDKDRALIEKFFTAIQSEETLAMQRFSVRDLPKTQQEFLERHNPRLGLFNSTGRSVQKHGLTNMVTIEQTYFDPESGRTMQKVEHSISFANVLELYRTWEIFVIIMGRLGFGTYGGWDLISAEVYTVCSVHGVGIGHKYITECLNALDTKAVPNPVELLSTGRAYMFLNTLLCARASSSGDPSPGKPKGKTSTVGEQCSRGPVTMLKEFASIIKINGKTAPCYNFNNGTNCMYGVDDKRFNAAHKGKCAFHHVCETCGSTDHGKINH